MNLKVHQGLDWKQQGLPVERRPVKALFDFYDRQFSYLRLSLTEKCNFKCAYCLPDGYKPTYCDTDLSISEIQNLLIGFRELGITKLRLTGGEPTLRRDIVDIVALAKHLGLKKIALTTNGYRLQELAKPLKEAGLTNLNVSIDSLNESNFQKITGHNSLKKVLSGIESALSLGIPVIKINTVLLRDLNDFELADFMEYVRKTPVSVRFIELMQTGENWDYFKKHHLSSAQINSFLKEKGWNEVIRKSSDGPAVELSHPDFLGRMGTIAPYSKDFCKSCNRLRVSGRGRLQLCLFGDGQTNLRDFLQSPNQKDELKRSIVSALSFKPAAHDLSNGISGKTTNLSMIGG